MTAVGLLDHPFLEGLDDDQRRRLAAGARPFQAAAGDYLARQGEPADAFYLLSGGQVALGVQLGERGAVPVQTVGAGEVVGWSWLVPPYRWQFDARALDAVNGVSFDAGWLREPAEADPRVGFYLARRLVGVVAGRLAATRVQQLDIYR
jgi:CRP-like cAMP-binding protein